MGSIRDKCTIDDLRMEPAENGVIISYTEKTTKPANKGTYENTSWNYKKEVFSDDPDDAGDDANGANKAFVRFKELWSKQYAEYNKK